MQILPLMEFEAESCFSSITLQSSSRSLRGATTTCSMCGTVSEEASPSTFGFTGTVRQPTTSNALALAASSTNFLAALRFTGSWSRKIMPSPSGSPRSKAAFTSGISAFSKSQGTSVSNPLPSPDTLSEEQAPRCSMQPSAPRARSITSWLPGFPGWAMKPTPQASRSSTRDRAPSCTPAPNLPSLESRWKGVLSAWSRRCRRLSALFLPSSKFFET
mmetsp:Transcript_24034/g.49240  ORF Transcript_24034/g.49240 Transcript_24034/m.49240 type:complete len:217 (-) Transcript_24034:172-822(-)